MDEEDGESFQSITGTIPMLLGNTDKPISVPILLISGSYCSWPPLTDGQIEIMILHPLPFT